MDASYIPIAEARGFTTHWIKKESNKELFCNTFSKIPLHIKNSVSHSVYINCFSVGILLTAGLQVPCIVKKICKLTKKAR